MSRIIKLFVLVCFFASFSFAQKKMDFRSENEQLKDPKIAMKRSLIFPGSGQLYNDQKIKGSILIAGELFALWSFNENKNKYDNYDGSERHSRDYYLRKRNRFAWMAAGLYFYGMLDAVVEAHLDNFDKIVEENDPLQGLEGNSD
tara:strand:- start:1221 stop:1655 length:435 start_codon:yes stop_codon:yes gene_type:complete